MRLRTLQCFRCGGTVSLKDGQPTVCKQCGEPVTINQALDYQRHDSTRFPNRTPIKLGMRGMLGGKEYEVIGRVVLGMVEDGTTYYWDEFQLISPEGDVLYLEYDEGRWKMSHPFVPKNPLGPQQANALRVGSKLKLDHKNFIVKQKAVATTHYVEGELTFAAKRGDKVSYIDAESLSEFEVIQWSDEEIEFYRGKYLSTREVFYMFDLRKEIAALELRENKAKVQKLFATMCFCLSLAAFIGCLFSFTSGRQIAANHTAIDTIPDDGVRFGPYRLDPSQRIHRLVIEGSMTEASAWVAGVLEEANGIELIGTQKDFWDESGYDDGYWHESDLSAHTDFVVKQPSEYYVRLYSEKDVSKGSFGTAGFRIYGDVMYPTYLIIYGVCTLIISLVFFIMSSPETIKAMMENSSD